MGNDRRDRKARWVSIALCALVLGLVRQGGGGAVVDIDGSRSPAATAAARWTR